MEVVILSREIIKPSTPTPPHLKSYRLSLLDQLSSSYYTSRVFFYSATSSTNTSDHLKTSLSNTLSKYYPFAGRLKDNTSIDCNGEGVEFFEVQINRGLSSILSQPNPDQLHLLFPSGLLGNNAYNGSLVVIQINHFMCGGLAIGVCISHKVADGCTMISFIKDWSVIARGDGEMVEPIFICDRISSCLETENKSRIELKKSSCITRRFVFDASQIANLKAKTDDLNSLNPTRTEVVTALLYKTAIEACRSRSNSSLLIQTVNMRSRMIPPLPENSVGNFSWHFTVPFKGETDCELVVRMRKEMELFCKKYGISFKLEDWFDVVKESMKEAKGLYDDNIGEVYVCSSTCRFPFYEVDFGWGKPVWVAIAGNVFKNTFVLMDTVSGDGIEAWVTLDEQVMADFESDEVLLSFSTLNPSVIFRAVSRQFLRLRPSL